MSTERDEARALRFMVDELREEPTPEIGWDAVERKLLARIARNEEPRYAPRAPLPSPFARAASFAVAAAVLALGIGLSGMSRDPAAGIAGETHPRSTAVAVSSVPLAVGEAGARGDRDFGSLRVGDAIETGDQAATFVQAGSVRWTLMPASRAVVRARGTGGVGHVVALERGSIRAEVTPRDPAEGLVEAFAVEAGGTRVAVHGTLFTVTLLDNQVVVDVEHGAVAIGPVGHVGVTTGHLLVGPARASFSLDGGRVARRLDREPARVASAESMAPPDAVDTDVAAAPPGGETAPSRPLRQPASAPAAVAARTPESVPAPAEPVAVAPEAPAAPAFLTEASIRAELGRCIHKSSAVQQSVSSQFSLVVRADGTIQSGRFEPPLKPEFMDCASKILSGRFESGPRTITLPISF